uniref:Uncharacterized protein n=1 Tax=Anopheles culicifacies TaxID=139723 RepID=A0A182MDC9_9DIPT
MASKAKSIFTNCCAALNVMKRTEHLQRPAVFLGLTCLMASWTVHTIARNLICKCFPRKVPRQVSRIKANVPEWSKASASWTTCAALLPAMRLSDATPSSASPFN